MPCKASWSSESSASAATRVRRAAARSDEIVDRRPVTPGDRRPLLFVAPVAALSEPRAVDQLIGDSLKCRDDDDERLPARFVEDDADDVTDAVGRGERGAAEFENSQVKIGLVSSSSSRSTKLSIAASSDSNDSRTVSSFVVFRTVWLLG